MKHYQSVMRGVTVLFLSLATSLAATAGEWRAYEEAAFRQAQDQGKTVVLDFHADWCGTCQKQKPLLEALLNEPTLSGAVGFTVNYDDAGPLKKSLKVAKQSTVVVFKGRREVARSMGMTDKDGLRDLIRKGL